MSIEIPNQDLVKDLHANIQYLKRAYPQRWQSMLEQLANNPNVDCVQLSKRQTPTAQTQLSGYTPERLRKIALSAVEGR